jgi:hypothetical protein
MGRASAHKIFIIFFGAAFLLFLRDLISMHSGFISGDYSVQFYPWSMLYAESIKNLSFPYWTRYVQSGFPLMAEGQVGGFYPLHIMFYFLLPFRVAYNYVVVVHFIIAGVFTYLYSFKVGTCRGGGTLAAIVFCFGSAYAGCLINTATLKTMAWFPLILLLIEYYFDRKRPFFIIGTGVILGIQLLAGASQVALYAVTMAIIYYGTGLIVRKMLNIKSFLLGVTMPLLALLVFLPQLLLTRTMSSLSLRSAADLDFALTLSLSPLNFISAVFPRPVFHGPGVYLGLLTLLFLISWFSAIKRHPKLYPVLAVFFAGIFIALGRYNPFFVLIIRTLEFYDFRGPSKVIVFSLFSASILAGKGFTLFFTDNNIKKRALKTFSVFLSFCLAGFFVARVVLLVFKDSIISFGDSLIRRYVHGKPFHPHDLDIYTERVRGFYDTLINFSSLTDPFMLFSLVFCVFLLAFAIYLHKRKMKSGKLLRPVFISLILLDLLILNGYTSALGRNIGSFETLDPEYPRVLRRLTEDSGLFRVLPYDIGSRQLPRWADPSFNVIHRVDSVAIYTPLASEYYRKGTEALEIVDSALGYKRSSETALSSELVLIRSLNVKYVISSGELMKPFLRYVMSEDGVFLYEVKDYLSRAFVSRDLTFEGIDPAAQVNILEYTSGRALLSVNMPYDGFLVFSENRFPGWEAEVNGKSAEIYPFSVIQAVYLEKGSNMVRFSYYPFSSFEEGDFK